MASFNSNRGQERYRKGQKYHDTLHEALRLRNWSFLDESTPEEDMDGIDYWWELSDRMYRKWPTRWTSGKPCRIAGVDYKIMFGDRLGVQTRMRNSKTDAYVFARVYPKLKKMHIHYINKEEFWSHPRLRIDVNRDGEEYAYIHKKYTSTVAFYNLGSQTFD
jgi:hypothetical protein